MHHITTIIKKKQEEEHSKQEQVLHLIFQLSAEGVTTVLHEHRGEKIRISSTLVKETMLSTVFLCNLHAFACPHYRTQN